LKLENLGLKLSLDPPKTAGNPIRGKRECT
jgi:hypothetical protein